MNQTYTWFSSLKVYNPTVIPSATNYSTLAMSVKVSLKRLRKSKYQQLLYQSLLIDHM